MSDVYCPKCKTLLNNDEKASGKCFNCGASFSIVIAGGDGYGYAFSFARFILPEIGTIVSGMMFLAIIGFIITTILGMIVSIKETKEIIWEF